LDLSSLGRKEDDNNNRYWFKKNVFNWSC
jgi:hypothetical protein